MSQEVMNATTSSAFLEPRGGVDVEHGGGEVVAGCGGGAGSGGADEEGRRWSRRRVRRG